MYAWARACPSCGTAATAAALVVAIAAGGSTTETRADGPGVPKYGSLRQLLAHETAFPTAARVLAALCEELPRMLYDADAVPSVPVTQTGGGVSDDGDTAPYDGDAAPHDGNPASQTGWMTDGGFELGRPAAA